MTKLNIYYDEEGDFLEINIGEFTETFCRDVADEIYERIDEKTGEIKGIGILNFKSKKNVDLPFKMEISAV